MIVGIPMYPDVDVLDVTGPFEMFRWAGFDVCLVAETAGPVCCRLGMTIDAPTAFADAPAFDILWTPGGDPQALASIIGDPKRTYLEFLIRQAAQAQFVCSVCEGALLLAAAGLLDGYRITTHWAFTGCFGRYPKVTFAPGHPRYWLDGNRLTGGGISSGLDEALELIRLVLGEAAAQEVQRSTQYYPRPPVTSEIPPAPVCPVPGLAVVTRRG